MKENRIVQISAGGRFSAVISEKGDLFMFGVNKCGQCGVGSRIQRQIMIPAKINLKDKAVHIECGANHSLLISQNGSIYSWGIGSYGVLGNGSMHTFYAPTRIKKLKKRKIVKCAAGFFHSLCIDEGGVIWAFGRGDQGQLGDFRTCDRTSPKRIEYFIQNNIKAKECAAGYFHSGVISEDGELFVFGRNEKYQLGVDDTNATLGPVKLKLFGNVHAKKLSMGRDHTALITNY